MDILYYSNYCKHSKGILDFLVKNDIVKSLNSICIDRRKVHPQTGQTHIILENGNTLLLPPNVHSVPCILLVKENYRCVLGNEIKSLFSSKVRDSQDIAHQGEGEPISYSLGNNTKSIFSEKFTSYSASTEELSAKGSGGNRPLYNYVSANQTNATINTPPDTYKPDKISKDITIDTIQQQRNEEANIGNTRKPEFLP